MELPALTLIDMVRIVDAKSRVGMFFKSVKNGTMPVIRIKEYYYVPAIHKVSMEDINTYSEDTAPVASVYYQIERVLELAKTLGWKDIVIFNNTGNAVNDITMMEFTRIVGNITSDYDNIEKGIPLLKLNNNYYFPSSMEHAYKFSRYCDAEIFAKEKGYDAIQLAHFGSIGAATIPLKRKIGFKPKPSYAQISGASFIELVNTMAKKYDVYSKTFAGLETKVLKVEQHTDMSFHAEVEVIKE